MRMTKKVIHTGISAAPSAAAPVIHRETVKLKILNTTTIYDGYGALSIPYLAI